MKARCMRNSYYGNDQVYNDSTVICKPDTLDIKWEWSVLLYDKSPMQVNMFYNVIGVRSLRLVASTTWVSGWTNDVATRRAVTSYLIKMWAYNLPYRCLYCSQQCSWERIKVGYLGYSVWVIWLIIGYAFQSSTKGMCLAGLLIYCIPSGLQRTYHSWVSWAFGDARLGIDEDEFYIGVADLNNTWSEYLILGHSSMAAVNTVCGYLEHRARAVPESAGIIVHRVVKASVSITMSYEDVTDVSAFCNQLVPTPRLSQHTCEQSATNLQYAVMLPCVQNRRSWESYELYRSNQTISDMLRQTMEVNEKFLNDLPWISGYYMGYKGLFQCLHPDVMTGAVATLSIFFWPSVAVLWATGLAYSPPKTRQSVNKLTLSTERRNLCCDCSVRYTAMSVSTVLQSHEELQFICHNAKCVAAVYTSIVNPGFHFTIGELKVALEICLPYTFNQHSRLFLTCLRCPREVLSELGLNSVISEGFVLFLISSTLLTKLIRRGIIIRAHDNGQVLTQSILSLLKAHKFDISVQNPWWVSFDVPSQTLQRVSMHLVMSVGLSGSLQLVQQDEVIMSWKGWSVSEGDTHFIFSIFFSDGFNWGISSARSVETFSSCFSLQQKNDTMQNWAIHIILPHVPLPHYGVKVAHHLLLITVVHCCAYGDISIFRSGLLTFMKPTVMGSKVAHEYPISGRVIMFYDSAVYSTSLSFGSAVIFIVQLCHWGPRLYFCSDRSGLDSFTVTVTYGDTNSQSNILGEKAHSFYNYESTWTDVRGQEFLA